MRSKHAFQPIGAAVFSALLLGAGLSQAADQRAVTTADKHAAVTMTDKPVAGAMAPDDHLASSNRERHKLWSDEKQHLERALKLGEDKAFYAKTLADLGYQITSINADRPGYVEYEIVKGTNTYEVQIDLDKSRKGVATKVDVTTNLWRTAATKAALKGTKTTVASRVLPDHEASTYSDRARMKAWSGEKERLEKALAPGNDKGYYADQFKQLGYQITSVNDRRADYVEYEVVKGGNSYEVQIDFDGGKAKKVDVTTNLWHADATDKALGANKH